MANSISEYNGVNYAEHEYSCPVHGGKVKKVYSFGGYGDADVSVFHGCGCALCADCERAWVISAELKEHGIESSGASYHRSYNEACGKARLVSMINASR